MNGGLLSGTRIVEFSAIGPVPWCAKLFSDMGADVVRIDRVGAPAAAADPDYIRGGRRVVNLNLKQAEGKSAALALIAQADVILEGLRPGVMEKLGLGPDDCRAINAGVVYGRMTGWGQHGPLAARAGHDINYIALSGVLHAIGPADRPAIPLNLVGDYGGGGAFLAIGVLAALLRARLSGQGEVIDAAMLDGAATLMAPAYNRLAAGQWQDARGVNLLDGGAPWYDVYETADGKFMAVGAIEPQFYQELLSRLEIAPDSLPAREDRAAWPTIRERLARVFRLRPRHEWERIFENSDACVTPVLSMKEAPQHPHNRSRGTFIEWEGACVPAPAPRYGQAPPYFARRSAQVSMDEILLEWTAAGCVPESTAGPPPGGR